MIEEEVQREWILDLETPTLTCVSHHIDLVLLWVYLALRQDILTGYESITP